MKDEAIKIVLADDHRLFRQSLIRTISSFGGMEVIGDAGNGKELIELLGRMEVLPDVCIVDVNMPVKKGFEATEEIKERWPDIRILAVSMYDTDYSVIQMIRSGATGYIHKDSDEEILKEAIHSLYEKGCYHSELVSNRLFHQVHSNTSDLVIKLNLSKKEIQHIELICTDLSVKELASKTGIKANTLEKQSELLYKKLGVSNRIALAIFAIKRGIVRL
jgi:two-component system, NarL family, invasion response regulator UvrY